MVHPRLHPGTGATIFRLVPGRFRPLAIGAAMLVAILAALAPARAQEEQAFAVRDVAVDVTAENAAAARDQAIIEGQRKAFEKLLLTLTSPAEAARLPPLDDNAISDMVLDFEVESESVSTVRYIGNLAFRFRAEPVQAYLQQGGASYAVGASRPALVIPVLTRDGQTLLWDEGNAWLAAWSGATVDAALVTFVVPLGDLTDIAAIDGPRALDGDSAALQSMATRYGAGDVVVAEARPAVDAATGEASVALDVRRYTLAGPAGATQDRVSGPGGEAALADLYKQAAQRVSAFVQDQLKQENLVSSSAEQRLTVLAPLADLNAWIDLNRRLADVPVIRQAELRELSRGQAKLELVFIGDQAQLGRALAQRDLSLVPIAMTAPATMTTPAPQTTGSVTVDPNAVPAAPPAQATGSVTVDPSAMPATGPAPSVPVATQPMWELRRGRAVPAATPSVVVPAAPAAPGVQPAPAAAPAAQPSAPAE